MGDMNHNFEDRAMIGRALRLKREIDAFEARWPTAERRDESIPNFSWDQLERQLVDLAATPAQATMARHLVSATRKLAPFKPAEMVLREILCMTWVLLDENFKPEASGDTAEMI
jgi:hypothetical protein